MKNIGKIFTVACLAFSLAFTAFSINLWATNISALKNTSSKVTSSESLSKKATLVLQEEYEGGICTENNQWTRYWYDLKTLSEYDYIQILIVCSSTLFLLDDATNIYQFSPSNRYFKIAFQSATNSLDFNDYGIDIKLSNGKAINALKLV